jgi:hypothetical protein
MEKGCCDVKVKMDGEFELPTAPEENMDMYEVCKLCRLLANEALVFMADGEGGWRVWTYPTKIVIAIVLLFL